MRVPAAAVLLALLTALPAYAQLADAEPLLDQVKRAYRETNQFASDAHFAIEQQRGRWHTLQDADMPVAFDRETRRLLVDRPDMRVVIGGGRLKLISENIPGRYLDAPLAEAPVGPGAPPITYRALVAQVPYLGDPPFPTLAFLLEDDPVAALTMGAAKEVEALPPAEDDDLARPRLRFAIPGRVFTLTIDPATKLIAKTEIDGDMQMLGGGAAGDLMRWSFVHDVKTHNQPLPADAFAVDSDGRVAVQTLQELTAPPDQAQMLQAMEAKLEGKAAPPMVTQTVAGEDFDLAAAPQEVVVLDFWATWCPPCEPALQELQKLHEWAEREKKPVAVYAVNMGEPAEAVRAYWEKHNLTLPVLLDPQAQATQAFGVDSPPTTLLIQDGQVVSAHVGWAPGADKRAQAELAELLRGEATP